MSAIRALAVFCEDIREESGGTHTIVGVLPDNLKVAAVPAVMPKLAIYLRVLAEPAAVMDPMTVFLVLPDGQEREITTLDSALIENAQAEAGKAGLPFGGIVSKVVMAPFPISTFGRLTVVLKSSSEAVYCASLNVQMDVASSIAPGPPT